MAQNEIIGRWTARFVSTEMEAAYRSSISDRNLRHNFMAIAIALPLNALYVFFDPFLLADPEFAFRARFIGLSVCAAVLCGFRSPMIGRHHEALTALIVLFLGGVINAIMLREPTLAHDYYVGLIQGGVFISFLLRIGFFKLLATLGLTLAIFIAIAQSKGQPDEAMLQTVALTTMFALCAFGVYLFERHRRTEFIQARTIEKQNSKLQTMLEAVQRDNERKLAAMNVLVHFVRTPIHQIVGFTGVIANSLRDMQGPGLREQLEHAEFVKRASADLSANVAKLLAYYRLDEQIKGASPEAAPIEQMLADLCDDLSGEFACEITRKPPPIVNYVEPMRVALSSLAAFIRSERKGAKRIEIAPQDASPQMFQLVISDDGPALSRESFAEQTKALTKIDNYLTTDGSAMAMTLRTVARAAEICGGEFTYRSEDDGRNSFVISFANYAAGEAAAA